MSETPAPQEENSNQLRNILIISISVAVLSGIGIGVGFFVYRRWIRKDTKKKIEEKRQDRARREARLGRYAATSEEPTPSLPPGRAPAPQTGAKRMQRRATTNYVEQDLQDMNDISMHPIHAGGEEDPSSPHQIQHGSSDGTSSPRAGATNAPHGILRKSSLHSGATPKASSRHTANVTQMMMSGVVSKDKEEDFDTVLGDDENVHRSQMGSPNLPKGRVSATLMTKSASFRHAPALEGQQPGENGDSDDDRYSESEAIPYEEA